MTPSASLFFASFLIPSALGFLGPVSNLVVGNKNIAPDGFTRPSVLAGSSSGSLTFPGPLIVGIKGTTFKLNVKDELTDPSMLRTTSIHWHGMLQAGTSWADGPVGVTQCPIAPGNSFLYQFRAKGQAGTFWYHSHHLAQYCDGLRGPLVVYDLFDPHRLRYDVDTEFHVITLSDWYRVPSPSAGLVPTPQSQLINGKGRFPGGPAVPLAVVYVLRGLRYRLRIINMACDPFYDFSIDGHNLTVIEADGVNTQPLIVYQLRLFAGQRYSVVLNANKPIANYWIRSKPNFGPGSVSGTFDGGINSAILRYIGAPNADPTSPLVTPTNPLAETNLRPLTNPAAPGLPTPGAADVNINLAIAFDFTARRFTVNGASFTEAPVPVLLQILSGAQTAQDLLPSGSIYVLPKNKVIEISMPGGGIGAPHPMHLHGHEFSVVRSAGSTAYNYANPIRRDVVSLGPSTTDNVTIRFTTDNSGPWIMHCHIDWHLVTGLSVVFAEDIPGVAASTQPPAWDELCPIYEELAPGTK